MKVREYHAAVMKFRYQKEFVQCLEDDLNTKISQLTGELNDAKGELQEACEAMCELGLNLKGPFMVKVNDDAVFRLFDDTSIRIVPIREE